MDMGFINGKDFNLRGVIAERRARAAALSFRKIVTLPQCPVSQAPNVSFMRKAQLLPKPLGAVFARGGSLINGDHDSYDAMSSRSLTHTEAFAPVLTF
jgi:hypothetical protein